MAQQGGFEVRGVVRDNATQQGVIGASVRLLRDSLLVSSAATNDLGVFRLPSGQPGRYRLNVRRIGYAARDTVLDLAETIDLVLVVNRVAATLSAMVTNGGPGVMGTVLSSAHLTAVGGATISIVGSGKSTNTDTTGNYALALKTPGRYLVRVAAAGFGDHLEWIDVPPKPYVEADVALELGR